MSAPAALFYGPEARRTYVSIRVAIVLLGGAALVIGFLAGFSAVLVLVWWFPLWAALRLALLIFAITALSSYLAFLKFWWLPKVDTIESDLYHLQAGQHAVMQPAVIETRSRTDGGIVIGRSKPPITRYQLLALARHVTAGGKLTFRDVKGLLSDAQFIEMRKWLWRHEPPYAWGEEESRVELTADGRQFFADCLAQLPQYPYPTGQMVELTRDRYG